jgi:hypothetical protein
LLEAACGSKVSATSDHERLIKEVAALKDPGAPPSNDDKLAAWSVRFSYFSSKKKELVEMQKVLKSYSDIITELMKVEVEFVEKEGKLNTEDVLERKQIPKINVHISTIPKLTKKYLETHQAWKWLEVFNNEVDPYVRGQEEKLLYLKADSYVDPKVWGEHLQSLVYPHTYESVTDLLDSLYPDKRTFQERLEDFLNCTQSTPYVDVYFKKKELKWSIVTDVGNADENQLQFFEAVVDGLCSMIKIDVLKRKAKLSYESKTMTYVEVKEFSKKREAILRDVEVTKVEYLKQFKEKEEPKEKKSELSAKVCFATQRGEKCTRVNCPFSHVKSAKVNQVSGPLSSSSRVSKQQQVEESEESSDSDERDLQIAAVDVTGLDLRDKARYQWKPDAECSRCSRNKKEIYDGHFGIDCPKAWCSTCSSWGHGKHRCPESKCDCGQKGHTNYSHGILPKGFSKGSA